MRTLHLRINEEGVLDRHPSYLFMGRRSEVGQPIRIAVHNYSKKLELAIKVMAFYDFDGKEYTPQVIRDGLCDIPEECLKNRSFDIQILCKTGDTIFETNKLVINQIGG